MFCRRCGEPIQDEVEICPVCGTEQGTTGEGSHTRAMGEGWIGAGVKKTTMEVLGKAQEIGKEIGKEVMHDSLKEVGKEFKKKAKKTTHKILVTVGLKKKSPLDKARDIWKKVRK